MRTRIDFQVAAFYNKPGKWFIRECSICNYPLCYVFSPCFEYVGFDKGCNCSLKGTNIAECSWSDLANYYNMQTDPEYIKKMDEFWGFE